jgi:hypothetical protein
MLFFKNSYHALLFFSFSTVVSSSSGIGELVLGDFIMFLLFSVLALLLPLVSCLYSFSIPSLSDARLVPWSPLFLASSLSFAYLPMLYVNSLIGYIPS